MGLTPIRAGTGWGSAICPVALAQHVDLLQRVGGAASLYAWRGARRAAAQGRGTWGRGADRDCWRVGSPAADHTTVLVPHHESASAVAWSPPAQAGPVAARRPWLAGCVRTGRSAKNSCCPVPAATEVVDGELVVRAGDEGGLLAAQSTHPPSRIGTAGGRSRRFRPGYCWNAWPAATESAAENTPHP